MNHLDGFKDLVAGVRDVGGNPLELLARVPDAMGRRRPEDRAWLALAYGATYSAHATIALWWEWPLERVQAEGVPGLQAWYERNGYADLCRKERQYHKAPRVAAPILYQAATVADMFEIPNTYEELWDLVGSVKGYGRYQKIKVCGALKWVKATYAEQPDIRAAGAKFGRKTLGMLDPSIREAGGDNAKVGKKRAIDAAEDCAARLRGWLAKQGLEVGFFELESLLCEYQQMLGGRLHPGKALGMDLADLVEVERRFGMTHPAAEVGRHLRGEILREHSWRGRTRFELDTVYRDHGYVWSDSWYDWEQTEDLSRPALRSGHVAEPARA